MSGIMEKALIIAYFVPIMVLGFAGNLWIIWTLIRILFKTWNQPMNNVFKHMSLYILSLSIADLCVLVMTPAVTSYFIMGSWSFGFFGCKVFFAIENVNKLLSVAILTLMSIERYFVICRPFGNIFCNSQKKKVSSVVVIVMGLLVVIFILCLPIIYYARTSEIFSVQPDGSQRFTATLCISALPDDLMSIFISYMFVLGFLIPVVLISTCYFFLIRYLRQNDGQRLFVTNYTKKVVKSVLSVVLFHFFCWGPFWIFVIIPLLDYFNVVEFEFLNSEYSQTIRMVSSFLPYLNSACNWIFYSRAITHARHYTYTQPRRYTSARQKSFITRIYSYSTTRV